MAAEANKFKKPEQLVPMADYTMDESQIMYDYCGIVIEDFAPLMDEADDADRAAQMEERLKNPGFVRALLHISYQRANPRASSDEIRRFFGSMTRNEAMERFTEIVGELEEEGDDSPPELTTEPDRSSLRSSVTNSDSFGESSTTSSDEPDGQAATTGTSGSGTSSPPSLATTSGR